MTTPSRSAGIRVLDATQMLAGPICSMRMADLGADVLKIEPPGVGDWTRTHGFANAYINGETTAYLGLNRNKRSVTLNLKQPDGLAAFDELVATADVFIQNYRVGTAERLGAGYARLREINPQPRLLLDLGLRRGRARTRVGPARTSSSRATAGRSSRSGSSEMPPTPGRAVGGRHDDRLPGRGRHPVSALLARPSASAGGQKVEVSMLGVVMDCQAQELTTYLNLGLLPERTRAPVRPRLGHGARTASTAPRTAG